MSTANVANNNTYFKSKDYNLKHHPKFTHKWKFCYHLLTLKCFQTYINFVLVLNIKEDVLKTFDNILQNMGE